MATTPVTFSESDIDSKPVVFGEADIDQPRPSPSIAELTRQATSQTGSAMPSTGAPPLPALTPVKTTGPTEAYKPKRQPDARFAAETAAQQEALLNPKNVPAMLGNMLYPGVGSIGSGTVKAATQPGHRVGGLLEAAGGLTEALQPLIGPAIAENPVGLVRGMAIGTGASYAAKKGAQAAGLTPEQQELAAQIGFFIPSIAGAVVRPRIAVASAPEGTAVGASAFGGRVRGGVKVSPEEVTLAGGIGSKSGRVSIPRGSAEDAGPTIEGQEANPKAQEAAARAGQVQRVDQVAARMARGMPPVEPEPPKPAAGPEQVTREHVDGIAQAIESLPKEQQGNAVLEAHENLAKWLVEHPRTINPFDGKIVMVKDEADAARTAQEWINAGVVELTKAADNAAAEKTNKKTTAPQPNGSPSSPPVTSASSRKAAPTGSSARPSLADTSPAAGSRNPSLQPTPEDALEQARRRAPEAQPAEPAQNMVPPERRASTQLIADQQRRASDLGAGRETAKQELESRQMAAEQIPGRAELPESEQQNLAQQDVEANHKQAAEQLSAIALDDPELQSLLQQASPETRELVTSALAQASHNKGESREPSSEASSSAARATETSTQDIRPAGGDQKAGEPPALAKGSRVQLPDGRSGTVTFLHPQLGAARVQTDDGKNVRTSPRDLKPLHEFGEGEIEQPQAPAPGKVGEMRTADLHLAPDRFQYKAGTDAEGVSPLLKEQTRFNPDLAGVISVWRDPSNGKVYVVNGHHRYELARRTGQSTIAVRHLAASNEKEARALGALQNIAEGRGTAVDAAKFMRDSGLSTEDLRGKGISLGEATAREGAALAGLDDSLFAKVAQKEMPIARAVAIAEGTSDHAEQRAVSALVERKERAGHKITNETLRELIDLARGAEKTEQTTSNLFGEQQVRESLALEKAEVSAYIKQRLGDEKRTFATLGKDKVATAARQVGEINAGKSREISAGAAQAEEVYNRLKTLAGPVNQALNEAARGIANGENSATVKTQAYERVRAEVRKALGSGETASAERSQKAAGGGSSLFRPETPIFYSKAEQVASQKLSDNMLGLQALRTLENNGVKAAELKWTGVDDWLRAQGKINKQAVLDYLRENQVQVQEVMKGANKRPLAWAKDGDEWITNVGRTDYVVRETMGGYGLNRITSDGRVTTVGEYDTLAEAQQDAVRDAAESGHSDAKYAQHTLPGDKRNYRELLLTLPPNLGGERGPKGWGTTAGATHDTANFRSSHFDEPNILAHVRFDDRVDAEGKKVLLVEEVQSDWHQNGKKQGYDTETKQQMARKAELQRRLAELEKQYPHDGWVKHSGIDLRPGGGDKITTDRWEYTVPSGPDIGTHSTITKIPGRGYVADSVQVQNAQHETLEQAKLRLATDGRVRVVNNPRPPQVQREIEAIADDLNRIRTLELNPHLRGVPDAPFKSDWHELAMKRMLRYAAENGYDKLAWVTGQQTAERYDLGKQVQEVKVFQHGDGRFDISARKLGDGGLIDLASRIPAGKLPDYVGKELAAKIVRGEGTPDENAGKWRSFSGLDLKVGGEWAKNLYDQAIPHFLSKYGKKWGAKVGETSIAARVLNPLSVRNAGELPMMAAERIHSLDITPEMKRSVLEEGQPLFRPEPGSPERTQAALAQQAKFEVKQPEGIAPYVLMNHNAMSLVGFALGRRFLGVNLAAEDAAEVVTKLEKMAEQMPEAGAAKVRELATALHAAGSPEYGTTLVPMLADGSPNPAVLLEELTHAMAQRAPGGGDYRKATPTEEILAHPDAAEIVYREDQLRRMHGHQADRTELAAEVFVHAVAEGPEGLAEHVAQAMLDRNGPQPLEALQRIIDHVRETKYGEPAYASFQHAAIRKVLARGQQTAPAGTGGAMAPVEGRSDIAATAEDAGQGSGRLRGQRPDRGTEGTGGAGQGSLTAGSGYGAGLAGDELRQFVDGAGSHLQVIPAGEQGGLFGAPTKVFKLLNQKTGESVLVNEADLNRLMEKTRAPAARALSQDSLFRPEEPRDDEPSERGQAISDLKAQGKSDEEVGAHLSELHRRSKAQSGAAIVGATNPIGFIYEAAKKLDTAYDGLIERGLQRVHLGRALPEVEREDSALASKFRLLRHAPAYFKAKADVIAKQITSRLSREQEKGLTLLADQASRDWLNENRHDEWQRYSDDPAIQKALTTYKPYEQEERDIRRARGDAIIEEDYLGRVYREHVAGVGEGKKNDAQYPKFDRVITPQMLNNKGRKASPEYYYRYGLHEFGPSFVTRYVATHLKLAEDAVATDFISKATKLAGGDELPTFIDYAGKRYYSPEAARLIRESGSDSELGKQIAADLSAQRPPDTEPIEQLPKPSEIREYSVYSPTQGGRLEAKARGLASSVIEGDVNVSGKAYGLLHEMGIRYLGPKAVVEALQTNGGDAVPQFIRDMSAIMEPISGALRQNILVSGIPHIKNILRRVMLTHPTGQLSPSAWADAWKAALSKELKERGIKGVDDGAFDALLKHGGISPQGGIEYKHYLNLNFDPGAWKRLFDLFPAWREAYGGEGGLVKRGLVGTAKVAGEVISSPAHLANASMRKAIGRDWHDILFGPGGLDQKARLQFYDQCKRLRPGMTDEEIADGANDFFGHYARAGWTTLKRALAPFMLFPGWTFSSINFALRHPIRSVLPAALITLLLNYIVNRHNKSKQKFDAKRMHIGGRSVSDTLLNERLAQDNPLMQMTLDYTVARMRGKPSNQAVRDAFSGLSGDAGALIGHANPLLTMIPEVAANKRYMGGNEEIYKSHDFNQRGVVIPKAAGGKGTEDWMGYLFGKGVPQLDSTTGRSDTLSRVGRNVGTSNYPEKRPRF